jgi:hypothetical protein
VFLFERVNGLGGGGAEEEEEEVCARFFVERERVGPTG